MYNDIMRNEQYAGDEILQPTQYTLDVRCKGAWTPSCDQRFSDLVLSIYCSLLHISSLPESNLPFTDKRAVNKNLFDATVGIPDTFRYTPLNIRENEYGKLASLGWFLQDHPYGTFSNARIASLIAEYI